MAISESGYNNDSITSLKGADRVRMRPGVMLGSDDLAGAFHAFKEVLGNSLDESRAGFGDRVTVTLYKDGSLSVEDHGRGVPMDWNAKEGRFNWQLVFDELYAGGKYDDTEYKFSVGLNGLGATATQYTSAYMDVISKRDGNKYTMHFKSGVPLGELQTEELPEAEKGDTGTWIKWKPDIEVFTDVGITFKMLKEYCVGQAHINKVTMELIDEANPNNNLTIEGQGIKFCLTEVLKGKVIETFDNESDPAELREKSGNTAKGKPYNAKIDFVLAITEECSTKQLYFHNTAEVHGGRHDMAFRDVLTEFFKNIGKAAGVTIQPYDYNDYISVIISTYSNVTSFANQTKDSVNSDFIYFLIKDAMRAKLIDLAEKGSPIIKDMTQKVINRALARKAAKEAEMLARQVKKATTTRRSDPEKFVACREKDPAKRELYIVEGDSALGSCKDARDAEFQAIIPVRGKTLNCLKVPLATILKNEIVQNIITVVGCGIEVPNAVDDGEFFDIKKLKYDKIIICTDADVDGFQIRVLIYTIFYVLMPQLLEMGKVYIAETPLFELETKKGSYFAYSVAERDSMIKDLEAKGTRVIKVNRSKGLGENTPEMMSTTTMNPATRKLLQLQFNPNDALVSDITNMLFGSDPSDMRKGFISDLLGAKAAAIKETLMAIDISDAEEEAVVSEPVEG